MKCTIHTVFLLMGHTTFHLLFYSSNDKYLLVSVTFHFTAPLPALELTDTPFPATQCLTGKTSTSSQLYCKHLSLSTVTTFQPKQKLT